MGHKSYRLSLIIDITYLVSSLVLVILAVLTLVNGMDLKFTPVMAAAACLYNLAAAVSRFAEGGKGSAAASAGLLVLAVLCGVFSYAAAVCL